MKVRSRTPCKVGSRTNSNRAARERGGTILKLHLPWWLTKRYRTFDEELDDVDPLDAELEAALWQHIQARLAQRQQEDLVEHERQASMARGVPAADLPPPPPERPYISARLRGAPLVPAMRPWAITAALVLVALVSTLVTATTWPGRTTTHQVLADPATVTGSDALPVEAPPTLAELAARVARQPDVAWGEDGRNYAYTRTQRREVDEHHRTSLWEEELWLAPDGTGAVTITPAEGSRPTDHRRIEPRDDLRVGGVAPSQLGQLPSAPKPLHDHLAHNLNPSPGGAESSLVLLSVADLLASPLVDSGTRADLLAMLHWLAPEARSTTPERSGATYSFALEGGSRLSVTFDLDTVRPVAVTRPGTDVTLTRYLGAQVVPERAREG